MIISYNVNEKVSRFSIKEKKTLRVAALRVFYLGWLDYSRSSYSHLQMMYAATSAITDRINVSKFSTKIYLLSTEKGRNPT